MKNDIEKEIGELIQEITGKGWNLSFDVFGKYVTASQPLAGSRITVNHASRGIPEALGMIVDAIRQERGEPIRAEELAKMLEADQTHADAPPVEIPGQCGCGTRLPLIVERVMRFEASWRDGRLRPVIDAGRITSEPQSGEIGTCPECGRHYTFRA